MSNKVLEDKFYIALLDDLDKQKLVLPTMPEVALKVRDAVADEDASAKQIADVIALDPAISARMIQVANSPLLRGSQKTDTVEQAITRMGHALVKSMVTSMAMKQIFKASNPLTKKYMHEIWTQSTQVASIASAMASHFTKLKPDQAMLAGLVHNIGALPIITRAEEIPALMHDEEIFSSLIERLSGPIGTSIMKSWNFPDDLSIVANEHSNYNYDSENIDYVDVVIVAKLQNLAGTNHPDAQIDWNTVPSFCKLGLAGDSEVVEIEDVVMEEIEITQQLFD
ncbi:MAG: HDOD domain-containing protein [gamma proteobacterium symbiont of Bathyaustriella thionipta]|nr:HDOD domain-containing protein [gamma proteobacterium symbiont of Bathyaustriella thionipta]MCU7950485.1 HDOD domain-containing protein [gamma proteobacterium symbiont of Bathyaustriella thionipta]MCU7952092.1 HDOD domain-containing protein [gamma proteobacterium symbiont of Bathyaustriella thionipta]MCU7956986.1 HDOD domain-containing protein [gamma proteobacterium symbiont of Bathyaustriella thionipta]MCU7968218.1 HDOD domain-containing protein [gamma proteobacterium symbiont of Bathyaustr